MSDSSLAASGRLLRFFVKERPVPSEALSDSPAQDATDKFAPHTIRETIGSRPGRKAGGCR